MGRIDGPINQMLPIFLREYLLNGQSAQVAAVMRVTSNQRRMMTRNDYPTAQKVDSVKALGKGSVILSLMSM